MKCIDQVNALIIFVRCFEPLTRAVRAIEHDISGIGFEASALQDNTERDAGPLADAAPALDAVMARDLSSRRQRPQLTKR